MSSGDFFADAFGFQEGDYAETRDKLLKMVTFKALDTANYPQERCTFRGSTSAGIFSFPSLRELRDRVHNHPNFCLLAKEPNRVTNIVADVAVLHQTHPNSVIQAASQFNLLEFAGPKVVPEDGIRGYLYDRTQGPICAMQCPFGTAYCNYLVKMPDGSRGQTTDQQLNALDDIQQHLQNNTAVWTLFW